MADYVIAGGTVLFFILAALPWYDFGDDVFGFSYSLNGFSSGAGQLGVRAVPARDGLGAAARRSSTSSWASRAAGSPSAWRRWASCWPCSPGSTPSTRASRSVAAARPDRRRRRSWRSPPRRCCPSCATGPALPGGLANAAQWANQPAPGSQQPDGRAARATASRCPPSEQAPQQQYRRRHPPARPAGHSPAAAARRTGSRVRLPRRRARALGSEHPPTAPCDRPTDPTRATPGATGSRRRVSWAPSGARAPTIRPSVCDSGDVVSLLARLPRGGAAAATAGPLPAGLAGRGRRGRGLASSVWSASALAVGVVSTLDPAGGLASAARSRWPAGCGCSPRAGRSTSASGPLVLAPLLLTLGVAWGLSRAGRGVVRLHDRRPARDAVRGGRRARRRPRRADRCCSRSLLDGTGRRGRAPAHGRRARRLLAVVAAGWGVGAGVRPAGRRARPPSRPGASAAARRARRAAHRAGAVHGGRGGRRWPRTPAGTRRCPAPWAARGPGARAAGAGAAPAAQRRGGRARVSPPGPGFFVGSGTLVSVHGVTLGAVPALPLLAALPDTQAVPLIAFVSQAMPALAGLVAGAAVGRWFADADGGSIVAGLTGVLAGVLLGVAAALLVWVAGGSLGDGGLAEVGAPAAGHRASPWPRRPASRRPSRRPSPAGGPWAEPPGRSRRGRG